MICIISYIMTEQDILIAIKLRLAVYSAGVNLHKWDSLEEKGVMEMMTYIFPKTGELAYYNLLLEIIKKHHSEYIPVGYYSLFKLPVQFEEEIISYLKSSADKTIFTLPEDPIAYLNSLSTVTCSPSLGPVYIGAIKDSGFETIMKITAFHYLSIFQDNTNSYPYFE